VTMDDEHTVIPHGRVLVRDGRIVGVWQGPLPPEGVEVGEARTGNDPYANRYQWGGAGSPSAPRPRTPTAT